MSVSFNCEWHRSRLRAQAWRRLARVGSIHGQARYACLMVRKEQYRRSYCTHWQSVVVNLWHFFQKLSDLRYPYISNNFCVPVHILQRQNHVFFVQNTGPVLRLAPASFQRTERMTFCLSKNDDRNGSTGVLEFCSIFDVYTTGSCCWINYTASPFIFTSKAAFRWTSVLSPRFLRGHKRLVSKTLH